MVVDPKLRDVLDTLDEAPARTRPEPDRDMLISVLRRLEIRGHQRVVRRPMATSYARPETGASQEELERIRAERDESAEALRLAEAEREALRNKQRELEGRLAALESTNHGSHLSFVDDDDNVESPAPIVEFRRVNLDELDDFGGDDEDLVEFEDLGSHSASAFAEPDHGAWDDQGEVTWEDPDEPARGTARSGGPHVQWDDEGWTDDDTSWEQAHDDPDPYLHTPAEPAAKDAGWGEPAGKDDSWEQAHDDPEPWANDDEPAADDAWAEPAETGSDDLDDETQRDLNELERQLRQLEKELAKRQAESGDGA